MATTYLTKTLGTPTLATKATCSMWFKSSEPTGQNTLIASDGNAAAFYLHSNSTLRIYNVDSSALTTNRVFRDPSAWYHLVVAIDTTQVTASNRVKVYINGIQETSFSSASYPNQNSASAFGNATAHFVGANTSPANYFNGYMNNVALVDGTALTPTSFGETDSASGIWKFKTPSGITWGNNGFHLKMDNSANLGLDSSGETNNFTLSGNGRQAKDTPTNVYATMNPLVNTPNGTYSDGNTQFNGGAAHRTAYGTLAFSTGKWYWEAKATGGTKYTIGLSDAENQSAYQQVAGTNLIVGNSANSYLKGDAIGWYYSTLYKNGSTIASGLTIIGTNDILRVAVDADAGKIYYAIGATWRVANSTTFNASSNDTTFTTGRFYVPACSNENCGWKFNFGNGYFGTTAITSAGSNGNGSLFEYDVPSGYYALNTKNINTYG